ncbi:hypothetical protein O3M35_008378 [Rhynocoris fuscipes]|uniref:Uncharacterized protein n=1 Tax=Rhynocoris fuscipes TaxID=488301 RepID=A0AAW1D628_9HEMI
MKLIKSITLQNTKTQKHNIKHNIEMYRVFGKLKEITREQIWPYAIKEGWKTKLPMNTYGFQYKTICQHLHKKAVQNKTVTPHLLYPVRYKSEHLYQFKLPFDIFGLFGKKKDCGKKKSKGPIKKQDCKKKAESKCKTDLKKSCLKRKKPEPKETCKKKEKKSPCGKKKESPCGKKKESPCVKKKESPCGKKKESPCGKKEESPCGKKKESPCEKKKESPCGKKKESSCEKEKESPCEKEKESPCGKKKESPCGKKKESPCEKEKESPCEKEKESPCGKKKESPCKKKKESPCEVKKESPCEEKKESPCGKKKESPCEKKKESPCGKKKDSPCGKKKESPCEVKKESPCEEKKESPCGKKKESPCEKKKESPCGKKKDSPCGKKKESPCGKKKESPCEKEKENPCEKEKESPCEEKKESPCEKEKESPCEIKKESPCEEKKESPCGKKKESPCGKKKKCSGDKKKETPCGKKKESPCGKKKVSSCEKKKESSCRKKKSPCKSSFSVVFPAQSALWRFSSVLGLTASLISIRMNDLVNATIKFWDKNSQGLLTAFSNTSPLNNNVTSMDPNLGKQSDYTQDQSNTVTKDHVILFNPNALEEDLLDAQAEDCKKDVIENEIPKDKINMPCLKNGRCKNPQDLPTYIDDAWFNNEKFPFTKISKRCYINELKKQANTRTAYDPCANNKLFLNDLLGGLVKNFDTGFRRNMIPKVEVGICSNDGGICSQLSNMNDAVVYYSRKVKNEDNADLEQRLADCKDDTIDTETKKEKIKMPCPNPSPCIAGKVSKIDGAYSKEPKKRFPFMITTNKCYVDQLKKIANNTAANDPCSNKKLFLNQWHLNLFGLNWFLSSKNVNQETNNKKEDLPKEEREIYCHSL